MSTLIAITYPDEQRAAEVLATLKQLHSEDVIDLQEAFYVTRDKQGDPKVHHARHLTGRGARWGALGGLLVGALFFVPVAGLVLGAAAGALFVKLGDLGVDEQFVKDLSAQLQPNSSAIFILAHNASPDIVVAVVRQYGGAILQSNLSEEVEQELQANLNAAQGS